MSSKRRLLPTSEGFEQANRTRYLGSHIDTVLVILVSALVVDSAYSAYTPRQATQTINL